MLNDLLSANWIKSAWGFLISAQQWYLSFFSYNNLMLFAWAGFVSAVWTFSFFANENHLNTSERESSERSWKRKCVLECVCVVIFFLDGTSKPRQSNKTACSVCIISHTNSLYTHNLSSRTKHNYTNAANHSSIFYARMHKTLASLCKLQLMWEGGKKPREHAENAKVERRSEREQIQTENRKRNKSK